MLVPLDTISAELYLELESACGFRPEVHDTRDDPDACAPFAVRDPEDWDIMGVGDVPSEAIADALETVAQWPGPKAS